MPEPWLRGPIDGLHPLVAPVFYAFTQAREDLDAWTRDLSPEQLWSSPGGIGSVGFHIRHIGRSVDRLVTYLEGNPLTGAQFAALRAEKEPGESRQDLLAEMNHHFRRAESAIRGIDPAALADVRTVGRQNLPTTVIGLLTHIAEHTQRHAGAAIVISKVVSSARASSSAQKPETAADYRPESDAARRP